MGNSHGANSGNRSKEYVSAHNRNNSSPILFNQIHGDNLELTQGMSVAKRNGSFCKAIAFSDRPVKINERVYIKFIEVSNNWSGVLRFGFTNVNPSALRSNLPKYLCPDLTSKPGFWAKAFSDYFVKKDGILSFYVNSSGDVHFAINGDPKGIFINGVDVRNPLWVTFDVYGNTTAIKLVDHRARLNNSRRSLDESNNGSNSQNSLVPRSMSIPESLIIPHFSFHKTKGKNIEFSDQRRIASRLSTEYSNAYVFTSRPILNETLVIQVLGYEPVYSGSLAFGLTSCDPDRINGDNLPSDSNILLDRPEYWVVVKDVANNPITGDEINFFISRDGKVQMSKNGGSSNTIMHVDTSVPLWAFLDIYGSTQKISVSLKQNETQNEVRNANICNLSGLSLDRIYQPTYPTNNNSEPASTSLAMPQVPGSSSSSNLFLGLDPDLRIQQVETDNASNSVTAPQNNPNNKAENSQIDSPTGLLDVNSLYTECVACCERPVDSVFYNCGHMVMCHLCAQDHYNRAKDKSCCPICRAKIIDVIRTYKS